MSQTQQKVMILGFFVNPPFMLLSGFIFLIASMPEPVQCLTYLIRHRYFLVIIRGIFLKGIGLEVLWLQALILLLFGVGVLTLSALRVRKHLGYRLGAWIKSFRYKRHVPRSSSRQIGVDNATRHGLHRRLD